MPDSLIILNNNSFSNCEQLTSITLPANLSYIGAGSFQNTTALVVNLIIPEGINEINDSTFENSGITDVTIYLTSLSFGYDSEASSYLRTTPPSKTISFGKRAFANAVNIK